MLKLEQRRIFLCRQAVDMRKAFDALSDVVRVELGMDPFQGDVFIFISKDRRRAKVLLWEASGFWLCAKRLEVARFRLPTTAQAEPALPLSSAEVATLLEEVVPRLLRRSTSLLSLL